MVTASTRSRVRQRATRSVEAGRPAAQGATLLRPKTARTARSAGDPFDTAYAGNYASRGSADADWLHDRLQAVARTRHVINNEPFAASMVEQKLSLLVGEGWRFESAPDAEAFGLDAASEAYEAFAGSIERAWRVFDHDPVFRNDWEERLPLDIQIDLMARNYVGAEGEALGLVLADPDSEALFATRLQVVDPDRLAQPAGWVEGMGGEITIEVVNGETWTERVHDCRAGVAFDERNRPVAYHILDGHPFDVGFRGALTRYSGRWYPARTPGFTTDTRPCVLHLMWPSRAGQTRGISDFISALGTIQAFHDIGESERRSRLTNALIVAQYTSKMDNPEALGEILGAEASKDLVAARVNYYEEHGVDSIAGSRIIQPFPGDELEWNSEMRSANEWVDTMSFLALQAGAPIGLGYAMATRDFSRTTFSSARTEINDAFRGIKRARSGLKHFVMRKLLLAVLQEAFDDGRLKIPAGAPSIWENPAAYIEGEWIGPAREYVDPVKEGMGDRIEIENMSAAPSDIAARRGVSFDRVIARTARDRRKMAEAGVALGDISKLGAGAVEAAGDDEGEPAPTDRRGR